MKKQLLKIIIKSSFLMMLFLSNHTIFAQTTEDFESEVTNSTTFTDNGQSFSISSTTGEPYKIISSGSSFGWNGTSKDDKYIDNSAGNNGANNGSSFTIKTTDGTDIKVVNLYLYCSILTYQAHTGTLTITAKKDGATVYTINKNAGFQDPEVTAVNNGFTFINFATEGGSDNSTTPVDELIFTSTGNLDYMALDAFRWDTYPLCSNPTVPTITYSPATVCNGSTATLNISGSLNDASNWRVYTGSCGGTFIGSTATSSFVVTPSSPSTTYYIRGEGGCVIPGSCGSVTVNVTALDDASFSYAAASYTVNSSDPTPTITGVAGGSFSSTAGLNINASTGLIDVSASTLGTYTITYTTTGSCINSSTQNVTITAATPTVSTTAAASITSSGATLAGNASADGGSAITERGIVYSVTATNANPVIGGAGVTKDTNGSGTGVFSEAISGLSDNTQYSYKAYATNGVGTTYGTVATFTTLTVPATHLNFDGTDDYVTLGATLNTVLDPINTFTVEAWVRPETNTGFGVIIGNYNNGNGGMQFLLRRDGVNYTFWVDDGTGFKNVTSTGTAVVLNTWTHITGVWDGSTTKIYINGALSATTTGVTGASFTTQTNPIKIGYNNVGENFNGDIEEVRLWTKAVSATEISTRKDLELFGNEDGLLAYYKMNQGTNNANNAAETTLTDNSTNSYNGTLTNFALTGSSSNWSSGSTLSTSGVAPTISTTAAASITTTGATLAGNATADGGAGITERGIVYSVTATNANPLIGGASVTKIVKGIGTGVFSEAISGLSEATQYSYKAYATNGVGTSYGAVTTFTTLAVPPTVTTYLPTDNATNVVISDNLVLTFSENIVKGTGNIVIKKTSDNSTVETIDVTTVAVSVSGAEATINPSSDLALNTEYYVQIAAGTFKDLDDNNYAGIADTTTWSFTTETNQTNIFLPASAYDFYWDENTYWSLGRAPISTDNVIINHSHVAISSGIHATVHNITINATKKLFITGGGDLTVNGNLINNGTVGLGSGGSLIVSGTSTGNFSYQRTLNSANWYLLSSPFIGQNINTFAVTDVGTNAIATNGVNYAVAPYDNNGAAWNYYTTAAGTNNIASAGNFVSGKGYAMRRTGGGDVTFTGTMPTTNVNIAITEGTANAFNLIGNPYPSYLPANTNADAVNNILKINGSTGGSNQLQEDTLWFWDQSLSGGTGGYVQVNLGTPSRFIAPGQGFFVNAKTGGGTFSFTEAMQSHQITDVFSRTTTNRFEINLAMTDGASTKNTEIYYINGTTTAFDNGYDSSIFGGTSNAFAVYTQTVTDSQGRKLGIQSLPDSNYENMIIPIGVNATAGTEITFSINAQNIPNGLDIYLENRTDNTFTKLNENGSYTITLEADSNGVGQFYLRTTSSALGLENVTLEGTSIYKTNNETLQIIGLPTGKASVRVFSILGKKVLQTSFESAGSKTISLPKVASGVYLVNLQTAQGKMTKKIIME